MSGALAGSKLSRRRDGDTTFKTAAAAARAAAARAVVDVVVENALAVPTRRRARVASIFYRGGLVAFF